MAMVSADGSSQSFGGLTALISWFGLRVGGHPALGLPSSNESGELSQCMSWWQHHKQCITTDTYERVRRGPTAHNHVLSAALWVHAHLRVPSAPGSRACGPHAALDPVPVVIHDTSTFNTITSFISFCKSCGCANSCAHYLPQWITDWRECRLVDKFLSLHYFRQINQSINLFVQKCNTHWTGHQGRIQPLLTGAHKNNVSKSNKWQYLRQRKKISWQKNVQIQHSPQNSTITA